MPERDVRPDAYADVHRDTQLLHAFADERVDFGLPRFDLTARKLPPTCEFRRFGTRARQHPAALDDGGSDYDTGRWPFGLHEPSECQIDTEMYALPSLWLPDVGYVGSRQSVVAAKHWRDQKQQGGDRMATSQ